MFNSVHDVEIPSEMSYLLFISPPFQNRRMAECSLPVSQELCLEITVLARIAESRNRKQNAVLEIKIASAVNQICRFASTKSSRIVTVACHRHSTELSNSQVMSRKCSQTMTSINTTQKRFNLTDI